MASIITVSFRVFVLSTLRRLYFSPTLSLSLSLSRYVSLSLSVCYECHFYTLGNCSRFESQLLGFENLGTVRCCVLLLLWNFNLSLFFSRCVSLSLSLFLFPFIAFVVDIILTVIVEYFWDLHCLAIVCCFWYLQLCLFYFCLSGTTILTIFLLAIALFVCIVCHYCLLGTTILTLINHGIFVLVFALIVCIVSCFSRTGWVHVFSLLVLYAFLFVY